MVAAMVFGGLRRCEVLGLRLADFDLADRRVTITEGTGGHHRIVPVASGFFTALSNYLDDERVSAGATTLQRVRDTEGTTPRAAAVGGGSR